MIFNSFHADVKQAGAGPHVLEFYIYVCWQAWECARPAVLSEVAWKAKSEALCEGGLGKAAYPAIAGRQP